MPRILIERKNGKVVFTPDPTQIPVNERVFWVNDDNEKHQISLTGEVLNPGDSSDEVVITGDRTYKCLLHEGEEGSITITIQGIV